MEIKLIPHHLSTREVLAQQDSVDSAEQYWETHHVDTPPFIAQAIYCINSPTTYWFTIAI